MRTRSPRTLQHTQPLSSRTISSSLASTSRWSSPTSPNSLTITAVRASAGSRSRLASSVVLPLPRKPVITETGTAAIVSARPRRGRGACCAPITRRPAGASGASSSRSRRSRPGSPAWRPSPTAAPEAGSRSVTAQPAGASWLTRISGPVRGAMTNPFASSGSGPTVPATPQMPSAPEKTREIRACHAASYSTRESYAGPGDDERLHAAGSESLA